MFRKVHYRKRELIYFFIAPLVLLFALEYVRYGTGTEFHDAFHNGWYALKLLVSYLFVLSWEGLFLALFGSTFAADAVVSVLLLTLGLISNIVSNVVGDPLLPNHIFLAANAGDISSMAKLEVTPNMVRAVIVVLVSLGVHAFLTYWERDKSKPKKRHPIIACILVAVCAANTYLMCFNQTFRYEVLNKMDVTIVAFNPISDYRSNGLVLTFFTRIGSLFAEKPEGYNADAIREVKNEYQDRTMEVGEVDKAPNIIAIQSEALWDPTRLPNVEFSQDPMPFLHQLQEEGKGGNLVSPVFAGGTCMPEFEFLTGFSTRFLYSTAYPYIQYVTRPTPSFVSMLKDGGYQTLAMHMYRKNFYSRNTAYPMLGFEKFIGITDMEGPKKSGAYVSDMEMTERIIDAYEHKEKDALFMFNVSMQNHGAYKGDRYDAYDIDLSCEGMSEEDLGGLQAFTQGVYEADIAYRVLTEYFAEQEEPTVIIMYGDHLPLLGTNNSTYKIGGIVPNTQNVDFPNEPQLYETPYVVWANYDTGIEKWPEHISAAKLGLCAFRLSGVTEYPWYVNLLDDFYSRYDVFQHYIVYDAEGKRISNVDEELEKYYKWIQYDVLNGKRYYQK